MPWGLSNMTRGVKSTVTWDLFNLINACHCCQDHIDVTKGRCQISLALTINFSQKFTEPSKRINHPVGDFYRCFTKLTAPSACALQSNLTPPTDGTNGFLICDLSQTFRKQVTNVSPHVFVILLWGILMSPLKFISPC